MNLHKFVYFTDSFDSIPLRHTMINILLEGNKRYSNGPAME